MCPYCRKEYIIVAETTIIGPEGELSPVDLY